MFYRICCIALLSVTLSPLFSQDLNLALGSGAGSPGGTVSLPISLTAPGGQAAALQWKLTYTPSDFSGVTIGLGPAGSSVNKALACNTGTPGQYACLVSGMN